MRIDTFDDYQIAAMRTKSYDGSVYYPTLGLTGEAGEVANQVKKLWRDDGNTVTKQRRQSIAAELGDVLWYIAALCTDLGLNMGDVARKNAEKLLSRKRRRQIHGEGDSR